jgi:glycerophosphoryl diester phosphodiesterase
LKEEGFMRNTFLIPLCFAGLMSCSTPQEKEVLSSIPHTTLMSDRIVIAHRGASGYLPEHTLESKALAIAQGVQYVEQDLVMTKDDHLIVLHDHFLDELTNVEDVFPDRRRADGRFYAIDFTLEEVRSLAFTEAWQWHDGKKVQNYPGRFPMGKSTFHIHTLQEEIEFIQGINHSMGLNIGIHTEIKAPWLHHQEGKDIARATLEVLKEYGYTNRHHKVFFQCFDANELKRVTQELYPELGMDLLTVQLIAYTDWNETYEQNESGEWVPYSYDWMFEEDGMREIAKYAQGIGPQVPMLVEPNSTIGNIVLSPLSARAHAAGLIMHPYTLRKDALPSFVRNMDELHDLVFVKAKSEGVFTDFPDLTVNYLRAHPNL